MYTDLWNNMFYAFNLALMIKVKAQDIPWTVTLQHMHFILLLIHSLKSHNVNMLGITHNVDQDIQKYWFSAAHWVTHFRSAYSARKDEDVATAPHSNRHSNCVCAAVIQVITKLLRARGTRVCIKKKHIQNKSIFTNILVTHQTRQVTT